MATWTVLERHVAGDTPLRAAERVVFVRETFSWAALFFAPLVLLRYRLWLVLAAYVAVGLLLGVAELRFGVDDAVTSIVTFGFHVLIALELAHMRIRNLLRRGYEEAGVVVARDQQEAELRFFSAWQPGTVRPAAPASRRGPGAPLAPAAPPRVIGSFPEPYAP